MSLEVIYPEQEITRDLPRNIHKDDIPYFKSSLKGNAKKTSIKKFKNVWINNELFIKEGLKFQILMDSFGDDWQSKIYNRPSYQFKSYVKNLLRSKRTLPKALWIFDQFSTGGYFHWITEIAPRLWIANQYIDPSIPLLIPQYFLTKWKFANSFLIPFNRKIIPFQENEVIEVHDLTFITQTGGVFNYQPDSICASTEWLKNFYLEKNHSHPKTQQKIYISRNKTGKRTLKNEDKIISILREHDFKIIYSEELSLKEQIRLFSQTTHLLSLHGAGLSNMVFMPPHSKVIEIRHNEKNHMLNFFFNLAHTIQREYYYVLGRNQGNNLPNERRPEDMSIHVDENMLKDVLSLTK